MLKRRAFLLLGSAAAFVGASEAQAFFMGGIGVSGLANKQPPTISSMTPNNGPAAGGTVVSFIGCSFSGISSVTFGGAAATNVVVVNNDVMTCTAPPHANGAVNVVLTNQAGPSSPTTFTYGSAPVVTSIAPTTGPVAGGTPIQVFGSSFTGATEIRIGGVPATGFAFIGDGQVNGTTPPGSGVDDVVVTNANGFGTLAAAFTYTGTFSTSLPLGGSAFTVQQRGGSGGTSANADGTTTGYQSGGLWTILQTWVNFPSDDIYTFVIPAFCSAFTSAPANALGIFVDQLMIPSDAGTTTNKNWFVQFVSNLAPSQNYSYRAPVRAGWHSIQVYMSYTSQSSVTGSAQNNVHGDRLNINSTGAGLPAEPSPQTRDPIKFPYSSYHFFNTPFGANATWLALNNAVAQQVNGTGGNGANIFINKWGYTSPVWIGRSTDPVFTVTTPDVSQFPTSPINTPIPVRCPAGARQSNDNQDKNMAVIDATNPRYFYSGLGPNAANRNLPFYRVLIGDNYNLNHAPPQSAGDYPGVIRVADLDSGVIAHRILGGLAKGPNGNSGLGGFAVATQTSQWSGMPWPACESDDTPGPSFLNNPNGVPYGSVIGIPPGEVKPGGLNAATSMAWDACQNYGIFLNVSAGSYPTITVYAEEGAGNHPSLTGVNWATIVPHLSVMSNPAPIVVGQGFGGGTLRVPLLPGLTQGYPSIGQSPYTFPTSPAGIPIRIASGRPGTQLTAGMSSGANGGPGQGNTLGVTIPVGSFVFVALSFDRVAVQQFTSPIVDSVGNSYTIIQPTAATSDFNPALAVCLSTTVAIPNNVTWSGQAPGGLANTQFWGAYYLPVTGASIRVSNSATTASNVTTLSTTLAGVQAGDLIVGFPYTNNYAEIADPAGMGSLDPTPPMTLSFQTAATTGTFTYNPTWDRTSPAALVAVAFNVGASSAAPTVTTAVDTGTGTANGSTGGNRPVTITGTNFTGATAVTFGGTAALSFAVTNATTITCRTPPHVAGAVSVVVTTPNGSNAANTAYTYRLVDGAGVALTLPTTGAASATWGFSTLSFQEEWNDLLSVQANATDNNGSNYVTPAPGYNWYTQAFGWANTKFCGSFQQWLNGSAVCTNPAAYQFFTSQYYSVASSVVTMIGHVGAQPDTYATFNSTAYVNNANGFVGTPISCTNGWYIEVRCATTGTPSDVRNFVYFVDNEMLRGVNTTTFTEIDLFEAHPSSVLDINVLQWNSNYPPTGGSVLLNGPVTASFTLDSNFHVYGALFVPASRPGGGFLRFYIDGTLHNEVSITVPNGAIATGLAAQKLMMQINSNSNNNTSPMKVDYFRVWQQTPTG